MSHHAAASQQGGHRTPPHHQASRYENPAAGEDASSVLGWVPVNRGAGRGLCPDPERAAVHIPTRRPPRRQTGLEPFSEPSPLLRKRPISRNLRPPLLCPDPSENKGREPWSPTAACRPGLPPHQFWDSSGRPSIPEGTGCPALARKGAQPWCPQLPDLGRLGDHAQVRRLRKPASFPLK